MVLGEAFHRQVASRLAERLAAEGKQTFLAFSPENIRYLTGVSFAPGTRPLAAAVSAGGEAALYVPQSDAEYAASGWIRDVHWYPESAGEESPVRWIAREVGGPLAIDTLPAAAWLELGGLPEPADEVEEAEAAAPVLRDLGAELRQLKTPEEIALIERAAEYADLALERTFARLSAGSSERDALADVLSAIDVMMRAELGEDYDNAGPAISGAIRGGTNSAFPNAPSGGRKLARGESVLAEFTASVGGYKARSGATFFLGDPLRDVVRWVEATILAQQVAREAMTPGASAESVDQAARRTLERNGLGNALRHRTGHGIGLSTAEAPSLARGETTALRPGMVLVNQPGVYVAGRTGLRNSETVVIEEEGPRVLNPRRERWNEVEHRLKEF